MRSYAYKEAQQVPIPSIPSSSATLTDSIYYNQVLVQDEYDVVSVPEIYAEANRIDGPLRIGSELYAVRYTT